MTPFPLDALRETLARLPTLYFVTQHTELAKAFVTFRLSNGFTVRTTVKFTPEQATKAQRASTGITLHFL